MSDTEEEPRLIAGDVLFLSSNPITEYDDKDHHHELLDFAREKKSYIGAMSKSKTPFSYRFLGGATKNDFLSAIAPDHFNIAIQPTVLHLSCHAEYDETDNKRTTLLFERKNRPNYVKRITCDTLYRLLEERHSHSAFEVESPEETASVDGNDPEGDGLNNPEWKLRWKTNVNLIVLNCCQGDQLAKWLCKYMGAKHVIATSEVVNDSDTIAFFTKFYTQLFSSTTQKYGFEIQHAFTFASQTHTRKIGFKLYPEDTSQKTHKQYIFPISLLLNPPNLPDIYSPNATHSERSSIPRHLPPFDPLYSTSESSVPTSTLVGHLQRLNSNLDQIYDPKYSLRNRRFLFVGPPTQTKAIGWGRRTNIDLLLRYILSRPRFNIGYATAFNITPFNGKLDELEAGLTAELNKAVEQADKLQETDSEDPYSQANDITERNQIVVAFPDMCTIQASPPFTFEAIIGIIEKFLQTFISPDRIIIIATYPQYNSQQHLKWTPINPIFLTQREKAFFLFKNIAQVLESKEDDREYVDEQYRKNKLASDDTDLSVLSSYDRMAIQLAYIPVMVQTDNQLTFPVIKDLASRYHGGHWSLKDIPNVNMQFGNSPSMVAATTKFSPKIGSGKLNATNPFGPVSPKQTMNSPLHRPTGFASPMLQGKNNANPVFTNPILPTNTTTLNITQPPPMNQSHILPNNNNNNKKAPLLVPLTLSAQTSITQTQPRTSETVPTPQQQQQPPPPVQFHHQQKLRYQPTNTTQEEQTSATILLLEAFANIHHYPTITQLANRFNELSASFTDRQLIQAERDFFTQTMAPFMDARKDHIVPSLPHSCSTDVLNVITGFGSGLDVCSENYQKNLQRTVKERMKEPNTTHYQDPTRNPPELSFQKLRERAECCLLPYAVIKQVAASALRNEPSVHGALVSICFFYDAQKTAAKTQAFIQHHPETDLVKIQATFIIMKHTAKNNRTGWESIFCVMLTNGEIFAEARDKWHSYTNCTALIGGITRNRPFLNLNYTYAPE